MRLCERGVLSCVVFGRRLHVSAVLQLVHRALLRASPDRLTVAFTPCFLCGRRARPLPTLLFCPSFVPAACRCTQAPVHFLVIPKSRDGLTQLSKAVDSNKALLGHLMFVAQKVAKEQVTSK